MRHQTSSTSKRVGISRAPLAGCAGRFRGVLAGALALGWAAAPHTARAQSAPLELHVRYEAPAGCPSGVDFLVALRAHLAAGGDGSVDATVLITGPLDGEYALSLSQRVAGVLSETRASADSCETLMQLAALDVSMARNGSAKRSGEGSADATAETFADAAVMAAAGHGEPPTLPTPVAHAATTLETSPRHPGAGQAAPLDDAGALEPSNDTAGALHGFALAEARAGSGMFPGVNWGQGLALGASRGAWALRLSGTWWQPERHVFSGDGSSPIDIEFEQQSLELSPCAGQSLSALLRVEGCASLGVYRTATGASQANVWSALGASALAVARPWQGLRVEAAAQLLVPFSAPTYAVETLDAVYRADAVQPGVRLAIGWEFGSAPATHAPVLAPLARASVGGSR